MKRYFSTKITTCYDCPYSTNSSIEHDCAFTSAPYPTIWWCTNPKNGGVNEDFIIRDQGKIDDRCKLEETK